MKLKSMAGPVPVALNRNSPVYSFQLASLAALPTQPAGKRRRASLLELLCDLCEASAGSAVKGFFGQSFYHWIRAMFDLLRQAPVEY